MFEARIFAIFRSSEVVTPPILWSAKFLHSAVELSVNYPSKPISFGSVSDAPRLVRFGLRIIGSVQF